MAKNDVLKEKYIGTRLEIAEIEGELDRLHEEIGNIRDREREIFEVEPLPETKQFNALLEDLISLRRQAISYEQRRDAGVAGIDPLIGEWGLQSELQLGVEGYVNKAVLVSPNVELVERVLRRNTSNSKQEVTDEDDLSAIFRNPEADQLVNDLKLVGQYNLEGVLGLEDMKYLEGLDLSNTRLSAADWVALAKCQNLEQLRTLDLSNTGTGYLGVLEILNSKHLPALRTLGLKRKPARKPKDSRLEKLASYSGPSERLRTKKLKEMAARVNRAGVEFVLRGPVK